MKYILPVLLSALFFLAPLRLTAMEGTESSTRRKDWARKQNTESNSSAARIKASLNSWGTPSYGSTKGIEEKDNDETDSPLYARTYTDRQPQATIRQREFTVEDFRNLIVGNPHLQNYVLRNGYLIPDRMVLASQEEISNTWHIFFAAIQKEYGEEGETLTRQIQLSFASIGQTGKILYPALSSERIQGYLDELDSKHQPPLEKNMTFNYSNRLSERTLARASNLNGISDWQPSWKIKHDDQGYFASEHSPSNFSSAVTAVLCRNRNEREANRHTLDAITQELKNKNGTDSVKSASFEKRFSMRRFLGQPITAGAYQEWNHSSQSDYSFPLSGAAADACRGLAKMRTTPSSSSSGYTRIPENNLSFPLAQKGSRRMSYHSLPPPLQDSSDSNRREPTSTTKSWFLSFFGTSTRR